jgi:hypothetical protein
MHALFAAFLTNNKRLLLSHKDMNDQRCGRQTWKGIFGVSIVAL